MASLPPLPGAAPLDRLDQHQARLFATVRDGVALLETDRPDVAEVAQHRWRLIREARDYQLFKQCHIFAPATRGSDARRRQADAMRDRCIALAQRVIDHATEWVRRDLASCWAEYVARTRALLRAVELHLRTERAQCIQLYARDLGGAKTTPHHSR